MAGIDPAEYTVEEVKAWVLDNWHDHRNDAKVVGVHNAERDGKARVGLLDWLDHFAEDHDIDVTPRPGQQAAEPGVEVISLAPNSAAIGGPDVTMVVTGADATFNVRSEIIFNGGNEPTTLIDASHVSTTVRPSTATTPGSYDVWVWTDGTHDTAPAQFTFTPAVTPPPGPGPDELLTAQLRAWGISGEPVGWAPTSWQPVVYAIRAANLGFGTKATVDGLLDSIFPNNDLAASDICLSQLPSAGRCRRRLCCRCLTLGCRGRTRVGWWTTRSSTWGRRRPTCCSRLVSISPR
jgi:hypothetical protein